MIKTFLLVLLTISLQLVGLRVAFAQPPEPSADAVLEQLRQAYGTLQSYEGTCSATNEWVSGVRDKHQHNVGSALATIEFERGKRLSVEGIDGAGYSFHAVWTPGKASVDYDPPRSALMTETIHDSYVDKADSPAIKGLTSGLSTMTFGAGDFVPALLFQLDIPGYPFPLSGPTTLRDSQTIAGHECYVVTGHDTGYLESTVTLWIDKKTFLLRRMQKEHSEVDGKFFGMTQDEARNSLSGTYGMTFLVFVIEKAQ